MGATAETFHAATPGAHGPAVQFVASLGFDTSNGDAVAKRFPRLEDPFGAGSGLIAEAEQAGGSDA